MIEAGDCIFYQIAKTNQAAAKFWANKISHLSITAVQGMVLNHLYDKDSITSKDLGERTRVDSATLTGILDRLEALQYIERKNNPNDRRAILVCLTPSGKNTAVTIKKINEEANEEFLSEFNKKEKLSFRKFLKKSH
ncbi:MAG: winged helix-turn-helix transcriptional regulator [bacterium]|nr:winged helix-turn-helix transcriptional regulator [bacterium]